MKVELEEVDENVFSLRIDKCSVIIETEYGFSNIADALETFAECLRDHEKHGGGGLVL